MKFIIALFAFFLSLQPTFGQTQQDGTILTKQPPGAAVSSFSYRPEQYYAAQGVAYTATTNVQNVPVGDFLNVTVCNTAATGGNKLYYYERRFDNGAGYNTAGFEFFGVPAPNTIASTTNAASVTAAATTAGGNSLTSGAASTIMTMTYSVGTAHITNAGGTFVGSGYLPTDSTSYTLIDLKILPPGQCYGQYIQNQAAAVGGAAAGAGFTGLWWEAP